MQRHTKTLQTKSRTHQVSREVDGWKVVSGASGKTYRVFKDGDRFYCGCKWHEYHPGGECSHVAAVRNWISSDEGRRVYLKDSVEAYRRSHAKYEDFNEGIIYTSRKIA